MFVFKSSVLLLFLIGLLAWSTNLSSASEVESDEQGELNERLIGEDCHKDHDCGFWQKCCCTRPPDFKGKCTRRQLAVNVCYC